MTEEKHPVFQGLVTAAYKRWSDVGDLRGKKYWEFLMSLEAKQNQAVLLGNLNYQIGNGGFRQWVDNGYGTEIDNVLAVLGEVGTANAHKVIGMLESLRPFLREGAENRGCFSTYWIQEETEEECSECNGSGYIQNEEDEDEEGNINEHEERCDCCNGSGYCEGPEEDSSEGIELAEKYDNEYYALKDQFLDEIEAFFKGEPLQKAEIMPKVPEMRKPRVKLVGTDGNAFAVLGRVRQALKEAKYPKEKIEEFTKEAKKGDYNDLLVTCMKWVDVH